jgi:hypothetical protein
MIRKLTYLILTVGAALALAQTGPQTYATPEEARDALLKAATGGMDAVRALFGPGAADIVRTGDPVEDQKVVDRFNRLAAEKTQLETDDVNPDHVTLLLGQEDWPFAIPIVRKNGQWYFDLQEGKAEVRRRTIGGNELDAIQICRGYVEAQDIYAETDWTGSGVPQYARKIVSTEGKKDGLYWPGEDSPVAAGFAKAVAEGYTAGNSPKPYHGYFYKVLLAQGPAAAGGAQDYVVHGLMIGGYALVAWPAVYGVSGIMTFIVNQGGVVYQKDLGKQTSVVAKAMTKFDPDKTWDAVPDDTEGSEPDAEKAR